MPAAGVIIATLTARRGGVPAALSARLSIERFEAYRLRSELRDVRFSVWVSANERQALADAGAQLGLSMSSVFRGALGQGALGDACRAAIRLNGAVGRRAERVTILLDQDAHDGIVRDASAAGTDTSTFVRMRVFGYAA